MRAVLDDLAHPKGTGYLAEVAIALARSGFIALDELARATGNSTDELLDAVEIDALEGHDDGRYAFLQLCLETYRLNRCIPPLITRQIGAESESSRPDAV